jgi:pseudaminic acid synthase
MINPPPKFVDTDGRVFIIAEISANHGQSYERAVELIRQAAACSVDAVKFQAYTPDTMTIDCCGEAFQVNHPHWGGQTLYDLYRIACTPWDWFIDLKRITEELGMIFLCTAFDASSVDMLESIGVSAHKIASFELVDIPLIEYVSRTGKPLILSTGMASEDEIRLALESARKAGAGEIILLKCISSYPADPHEMNLITLLDMKTRFECPVGFSDHSLGSTAAIAAVSLGATMVEKHFTLSRNDDTPDSFFSMQPAEMKSLVEDLRVLEVAIGKTFYGPTNQEMSSMVFRRSLFAVQDIARGDTITPENIRSIRPGYGLPPKYLKEILGRSASMDIPQGTPFRWEMVSDMPGDCSRMKI